MKWRWGRIGAAVFALAALGIWWSRPVDPPEPTYQGRSLGAWLDDLHPPGTRSAVFNPKSVEAVRAIGPAAVPTLLAWSEAPIRPFNRAARYFLGPSFAFAARLETNSENWQRAKDGFGMLGAEGRSAFPALVATALHSSTDWRRYQALDCLRNSDAGAMRLLAAGLRDANPEVRLRAIEGLLRTRAAPGEVCLPALEAAACDPDPRVAAAARDAVATFGRNLRNILTWFRHPDPALRVAAAIQIGGHRAWARPVLADLEAHAADPDPGVRAAVAAAIDQIRGDLPGDRPAGP